jgi:hypothetical protein
VLSPTAKSLRTMAKSNQFVLGAGAAVVAVHLVILGIFARRRQATKTTEEEKYVRTFVALFVVRSLCVVCHEIHGEMEKVCNSLESTILLTNPFFSSQSCDYNSRLG